MDSAVSAATSSPDYSHKFTQSATKNRISSRSSGGLRLIDTQTRYFRPGQLALLMPALAALAVCKFIIMRCHEMKSKIWIGNLLTLSALLLSLSDYTAASDSVAYYSDNQNDRVLAFDPIEMSIRAVIATKGTGPYPIGKANDRTSYVTTRNSLSIDVLNNYDVINGAVNARTVRKIELKHSPRSFAYGPARGIAVVAGNIYPWATLLLQTNT